MRNKLETNGRARLRGLDPRLGLCHVQCLKKNTPFAVRTKFAPSRVRFPFDHHPQRKHDDSSNTKVVSIAIYQVKSSGRLLLVADLGLRL